MTNRAFKRPPSRLFAALPGLGAHPLELLLELAKIGRKRRGLLGNRWDVLQIVPVQLRLLDAKMNEGEGHLADRCRFVGPADDKPVPGISSDYRPLLPLSQLKPDLHSAFQNGQRFDGYGRDRGGTAEELLIGYNGRRFRTSRTHCTRRPRR